MTRDGRPVDTAEWGGAARPAEKWDGRGLDHLQLPDRRHDRVRRAWLADRALDRASHHLPAGHARRAGAVRRSDDPSVRPLLNRQPIGAGCSEAPWQAPLAASAASATRMAGGADGDP